MNIRYLKDSTYLRSLRSLGDRSFDCIIVVSSHILRNGGDAAFREALDACVRALKETGILMVQGTPESLPSRIEPLMRSLHFKYWIAVESRILKSRPGLPTAHAGLVVFAKSKKSFRINKVRFPHKYCAFCGKTVKDWGGKSHLMNPAGYAISDVWRDLSRLDNYSRLSLAVLEVLLELADQKDARRLVFPYEGIDFDADSRIAQADVCAPSQPSAPFRPASAKRNKLDDALLDVVHCGDAVEVLLKYPDNSVDLAFADPPYNLEKAYSTYHDEKEDERYIEWCNAWLTEYIRVLKPTGSLYLVNLPKWAVHHAAFLNERLHFQNWIAWDAISEPRGKIMPAHYALLFYTKHPTDFTFNYDEVSPIDAPSLCLRPCCVKERKEQGIDPKVPLTDIWWDVHRIRHKKDRDSHPCQLPEKLLERIVRLSSDEGDIVLDALCGTGTTAVVASKLGRRFVAADIDRRYVEMTRKKIAELRSWGVIRREPEPRTPRKVTKKELQLELRALARSLGRLPTKEDVRERSRYGLELFEEAFATWGKALKAAKLPMSH